MRNTAIALGTLLGLLGTEIIEAGDDVSVVGRADPPSVPTASPNQDGGTVSRNWGDRSGWTAVPRGGLRYWGPPYFVTVGPNGPIVIGPPPPTIVLISPRPVPVPLQNVGPLGGPMPAGAQGEPRAQRQAPASAPAPRPRRVDSDKRDQLVTIGDRLFRAGNIKRAGERYGQALRIDPSSATPWVRLAQVALARDDFAEAAQRFRGSVDAEPDWLPRATGVASIYGEPGDFDRVIARLETRILNEPGDRDAWLCLGAQYFLAGKTGRAADVFVRLSDRKPDAALAAFLDVTRAGR